MLKAVKENKIYSISEVEKQVYLEQGFNIVDGDTGAVIEHSPAASVNVAEVEKMKSQYEAEIKKLNNEIESLKLKSRPTKEGRPPKE